MDEFETIYIRKKSNTYIPTHKKENLQITYYEFDSLFQDVERFVEVGCNQLLDNLSTNSKHESDTLDLLLLYCSLTSKVDSIISCLEKGANPLQRFKGWTTLHWCASLKKLLSFHTIVNNSHCTVSEIHSARDRNHLSPFDIFNQEMNRYYANIGHNKLDDIDHRLVSWGDGSNFVLGHGDANKRDDPKRVASIKSKTFKGISTSRFSSAAIDEEGDVYIWGLGDNCRIGVPSKVEIVPKKIDSQILGNRKAQQIALSDHHGCLVTDDGVLFTFGCGTYGQLGINANVQDELNNSEEFYNFFTKVSIVTENLNSRATKMKVSKVCCSNQHTIVLTTDGHCWSFGYGLEGQLGHGLTKNEPHPRIISSLTTKRIKHISAGQYHSLFASDRELFIAGFGSPIPKKVNLPHFSSRAIGSGNSIVSLASGLNQFLVLTNNKNIYSYINGEDKTPLVINGKQEYGDIRSVHCWMDANYFLTTDGVLFCFSNSCRDSIQVFSIASRLIDFAPSKLHYMAIEESSYLRSDFFIEDTSFYPLLEVYKDKEEHDVIIKLLNTETTSMKLILRRVPLLLNQLDNTPNPTIDLSDYSIDVFNTFLYGLCTDEWIPSGKSNSFMKSYVNLLLHLKLHTIAANVNPNIYLKKKEGLKELNTYMLGLIDDKDSTDYTIIVRKEEYPEEDEIGKEVQLRIHKSILKAQSDWFLMMFSSPWREGLSNVAEIHDISYDTMLTVIKFCYTGTLDDDLGFIKVANVLAAADHLLMRALKQVSCNRILSILAPDNIATVLSLAEAFSLSDMLYMAIGYVVDNAELLLRLNSLSFVSKEVMLLIQKRLDDIDLGNLFNFNKIALSRLTKIGVNWKRLTDSQSCQKSPRKPQKILAGGEYPTKKYEVEKSEHQLTSVTEYKKANNQLSQNFDEKMKYTPPSPKKSPINQSKVRISLSPSKTSSSPKASGGNVIWDSLKRDIHKKSLRASPWTPGKTESVPLAQIQQEQKEEESKRVVKTIAEIIEEEEMLREHKMVEEYYEKKRMEESSKNKPPKDFRGRGNRYRKRGSGNKS